MTLSNKNLEEILKVAQAASQIADKTALEYFGKKIEIIEKLDLTPVTQADRHCEEEIRAFIRKNFPDHLIVGEEFGTDGNPDSEFKWWIDPIDGTKSFIRHQHLWGSVIGVEYQGQVVAGTLSLPVLNKCIFAAKGLGCFENTTPLHCSKISRIEDSSLYFGVSSKISETRKKALDSLIAQSKDQRGWGDGFGHMSVMSGMADIMIDFFVHPYDVSAVKICIEEAGGKFTSLNGEESIHKGSALSTNGLLHEEVLRCLKESS